MCKCYAKNRPDPLRIAQYTVDFPSQNAQNLYVFLIFASSSQPMFNPRQCRPISTVNYSWFEFYLEVHFIIIIDALNTTDIEIFTQITQNLRN